MAQRLSFQRLFFRMRLKGQSFTTCERTVFWIISMPRFRVYLGIGIKARAGQERWVGVGGASPLSRDTQILLNSHSLMDFSLPGQPPLIHVDTCRLWTLRAFLLPPLQPQILPPKQSDGTDAKDCPSKTVFSTRFERTIFEKTVSGPLATSLWADNLTDKFRRLLRFRRTGGRGAQPVEISANLGRAGFLRSRIALILHIPSSAYTV